MFYRLNRFTLFLIIVFMMTVFNSWAQDWTGYNTDNFAGVNRMQINPASIATTPYKVDVNIMGADLIGYNADLFTNFKIADEVNEVGEGSFFKTLDDDETDYLVSGQAILPSAIVSLDSVSALGFSVRIRSKTNIETGDTRISELISNDFDVPELIGEVFNNVSVVGAVDNWIEYNFTYARQLLDKNNHKLRVGITPKLITAVGSGYIRLSDLSFGLQDTDTLVGVTGTLEFGYSNDLQRTFDGDFDFFQNTAFGINIGVEYEFADTREYPKKNPWDYHPGYRIKIGVAYIDQGALKFDKTDDSFDYSVDVNEFSLNSIREIETVEELADTLSNTFTELETDPTFKVKLPATLAFQIDYHIKGPFYVNFSPFIGLRGGERKVFEVRNPSSYALTFRYEKRRFAAALPLYNNSLSGTQVGIYLRWGPLVLGSTNAFSGLFSGDSNRINLYTAIKLNFWKPDYRRRTMRASMNTNTPSQSDY